MEDAGDKVDDQIRLEPDGRLIIGPKVMSEVVFQTPGCDLWYNDCDRALAVKLLRNVDHPPYQINRSRDSSGRLQGELEVGAFLAKLGFHPDAETRDKPYRYHQQFHVLVIQLAPGTHPEPKGPRRILDDFPALED